ncbi:MAG: transglycosylase SLT domain-containing protein [Planctomycetes bacterium]|nr:transglycosylase SLT domain-containing protein [Planctomycetota bacterium]
MLLIAGGWAAMRWVCQPAPTVEEAPPTYQILLRRYARRANLPKEFVHKVVMAESSGRSWVVSEASAKGLMQIRPPAETDVLRKLNRSERGDLFDPEYNMLIGTTYLRMLTDRFDGDAYLVLAGYHMGPTRVARYRTANPGISGKELVERFAGPRTRAYCARILEGEELRLPLTRRPVGGSTEPAPRGDRI